MLPGFLHVISILFCFIQRFSLLVFLGVVYLLKSALLHDQMLLSCWEHDNIARYR